MLEWLEEGFSGFPVWQVRKRGALQRAFSAGESTFDYVRNFHVIGVFLGIATQIDRAFGHTELKA